MTTKKKNNNNVDVKRSVDAGFAIASLFESELIKLQSTGAQTKIIYQSLNELVSLLQKIASGEYAVVRVPQEGEPDGE